MKKINIKGITPSAITRVLVLIVALVNTILQMCGINALPITNDDISNVVSIVFLIIMTLYTTYKNLNVSSASQIAQNITDSIKNGELVAEDVEEILKKIKESRN